MFSRIKWTFILLTSAAGVIWLVNLPYPMIRYPIAKKAPLLLLPSFISMDHNYRGAINSLEQADQLVNTATSSADIERGGEKVKEGQKNLDNLPVWFLGYYPQAYCSLWGCTWRFTLDEFEDARRRVARMDAKVFQEKNALKLLTQGEQALNTAKQQYEQTQNTPENHKAIASMQTAIDSLEQIPKETLAGKMAATKLAAYNRDFKNITKTTAGSDLTSTLIEAAKLFALQAAQASQNPPHTADEWGQIQSLWSQAIDRLQKIQVGDPNYLEAQKLLVTYQTNAGIAQTRTKAESTSQEILKQANQQIQRLITRPPSNPQQLKGEIQGIINQLEGVKSGTTAYTEAQQLLAFARKKIK
ncbi:hypothetical protein G7B40_017185 [Aetokthonos hydrillicola Thurmond2011]|jgi:hypothetical protein|uniref:Uncharacterized protein n=1 Tax=Aetokthonos hydrillicola Thurmond2011 TaxID=2712845 RepID=A0AAP5I7H1_9CYAN|nr:hypothetical protein [Aetokthonos hydrillicola]MBO3461182.1 hypothetical protein [Aetokthonos hydrillicola CCALA 1050]MBW4588606.1 hypothetical protein [Aetokthonos hydrillicola CCALA 1050]MDR9896281.1 hypothetical protein [Aetokthonos hydrillicola Thurmond2011]